MLLIYEDRGGWMDLEWHDGRGEGGVLDVRLSSQRWRIKEGDFDGLIG